MHENILIGVITSYKSKSLSDLATNNNKSVDLTFQAREIIPKCWIYRRNRNSTEKHHFNLHAKLILSVYQQINQQIKHARHRIMYIVLK